MRTLKLGERAEFDPVLRAPSLVTALLVDAGIIKDPMSYTPEERVLKSYYERLVAYPVDKSRVIAIEFESEDPDLAAQATNAIGESYLGLQRAAKQDQSRSASQWLAGEIKLKAGDVLVQRGTNHAWSNRGTKPARVAFVLIDAEPLGIGHPVTGGAAVR